MKPGVSRPPSCARRAAAWLLARRDALDILHDLDELYQHKATSQGVRYARRWYWRQLPSVLWHVPAGRERSRHAPVSFLRQDIAYSLRGFAHTPRFTALVVMTLAVGIGATAPAFRAATSSELNTRGGTAGPSRIRWNTVLVSIEVALSLSLVVACGLLAKSFLTLSSVEVGFPASTSCRFVCPPRRCGTTTTTPGRLISPASSKPCAKRPPCARPAPSHSFP